MNKVIKISNVLIANDVLTIYKCKNSREYSKFLELLQDIDKNYINKFNVYDGIVCLSDRIIIELADLPPYIEGLFNLEIQFDVEEMKDRFKTYRHFIRLVSIRN